MFENLSERLERSFKILKGEGKITEINVAETLKDVRKALLEADVNYKVAKNFTDTVKQKALGQNVLTAVKPSQLMVKIVHDELADLMGGQATELNLEGHPTVILMAGLNGAGKTTMSGKLASLLKNQKHKRPLLAACDTFRPAAMEQLRVLAEQIEVPIHIELGATDPVQVALNAIQEAKAKGFDTVIVDTAGRQSIDEELMLQIQQIKSAINPHETLLVVDAMTGQDAVNTAKIFNEQLEIDGVILTKLDGDTRGGAALSIRTVVDKPIKFVGTGEKMDALDVFHPDRMADRILGMGDIVSLVERAQQQFEDPFVVDRFSLVHKFRVDPADSIPAFMAVKDLCNLLHKILIPFRHDIRPGYLKVIGGAGKPHCFQEVLQLVSCFPEFFDDRCFFALSRAASFSSLKAISFFITAFSALIYSFSALNLMSSSYSDSSSFLGLLLFGFFICGSFGRLPLFIFTRPLYPNALYLRTHRYKIPGAIPASRATDWFDLPARTRATNSYLASGVQLLFCSWCLRGSGPFASSVLYQRLIALWKFSSLIPSGVSGHLPSLYNSTHFLLNS